MPTDATLPIWVALIRTPSAARREGEKASRYLEKEYHRDEGAYDFAARDAPLPCGFDLQLDEHDHEDDEHHDGAGVDHHLRYAMNWAWRVR